MFAQFNRHDGTARLHYMTIVARRCGGHSKRDFIAGRRRFAVHGCDIRSIIHRFGGTYIVTQMCIQYELEMMSDKKRKLKRAECKPDLSNGVTPLLAGTSPRFTPRALGQKNAPRHPHDKSGPPLITHVPTELKPTFPGDQQSLCRMGGRRDKIRTLYREIIHRRSGSMPAGDA